MCVHVCVRERERGERESERESVCVCVYVLERVCVLGFSFSKRLCDKLLFV